MNPVATINYSEPDGAAMERKAKALVKMVNDFEITDQESFELAVSEAQSLKARMKTMQEQQDGITKPIRDGLEKVYALFRGPRQLMESCEKIWKAKISNWQIVQENKAKAEAAAAEAKAQAERDRIQREADELRIRAEAAATPAEKVEAMAEAESLEAAAAVVTAATPMVAQAKIRGMSTAKGYDYVIEDKLALAQHIIDNAATQPDLVDLLLFDSIKMKGHIQARGKNLNFPGVVVTDKRTVRLG